MYKATDKGNVLMNPAEVAVVEQTQADAQSRKLQNNISDLWNAADRYIYRYINGVGLSILSAGVHANKPKARACAKWSDSVWAEYYVRKTKLEKGESVSMDFSDIGAMPHDILELREEIQDMWLLP